MQVLKDYVRTNILESARKEFLDKGYTKASMREIAVNAGITVGNIYRYYESKEYLFEAIVDPTFVEITDLFSNIQINNQQTNEYVSFRETFTNQFMKIVDENKDEIVILIKCSEGTRYKSAKSQFAEIIETKVNKYVVDAVQMKGANFDKGMISRVVSKSVVDGLTEVIVYNGLKDMKRLENDVRVLMDLYFNNILTRFEL
jgi:AcrR family transcriptional regulator